MSKRKDIDLIDSFFDEGLSESQKEEFLQKAKKDPEFLREFIKGIELEEAFNELFKQGNKKAPTPFFKRKSFRLVLYSVSAAVLISFTVFMGVRRSQRSILNGEKLFAEYYEPFNLGLTRSSTGKQSVAYLYHKYLTEDYQIIEQTDIDDLDLETPENLVYLIFSVAAIENGEFEKASALLDQLSADGEHYLISYYYKALLHIRQKRFQEAVPYLKAITSDSLIFRQESKEILEYMKKKGLIN